MRPDELSPMQLDALRELGSIGAGHAATALSQLVDARVDLSIPNLQLLPVSDVPSVFGGAEALVAAAYHRLLGDLEGSILFVCPRQSALALFDLLRSREVGTTKAFGVEQEMLIGHVASILTSAYLAAIARMTDLNVLPAPASFAMDMAGGVLEIIAVQAGMKADVALLILTRFFNQDTTVDAYLFFMPDPDSLDVVLSRLGIV